MPLAPPYPGYPVYASMPGGQMPPASMPLPPAESPAPAKRSLSPLVPALLLAATVLMVAGALALGIVLNGGDWASGAIAGGIAALALAGAYLVGTLVRVALGRRSRQAILLGLGATLVLGLLGGTGLVLPTPLHRAQASTLENNGDWSGAIHEYELAGEQAPGSHDLARLR